MSGFAAVAVMASLASRGCIWYSGQVNNDRKLPSGLC
jgi:hypothetical protein